MICLEIGSGELPLLMKHITALGLFSGGLDSMLAVSLLRHQGIAVTGLVWTTPFFGAERALESAAQLDLPLKVEDLTEKFLPLLRQPPHGFGRELNPCIDCHILMLREGGKIMTAAGYDFLFTGEVLGQRPFSQHKGALNLVARESGYADVLLRPLCARLLKPTRPELEGLVDRNQLLNLSGRGRKRQMALAAQYGITNYPSPAGGCLLTNAGFAARLRDLLQHQPQISRRDLELLKWGRHFRLSPSTKLVVGRHQRDNEAIAALSQATDLCLRVSNFPGPLALIPNANSEASVLKAAAICTSYSDAPEEKPIPVIVEGPNGREVVMTRRQPKQVFHELLIH
ncbi:MAG: tRNA 4-thiouridine(8) synthase ThiI [Deltaproteobacteria bacterium]|nr:tRNA 4-thiouridine(8) synthase ThiI [Deltaproteobacteria bacterium]MBW1987244.1 tRNA 4-thiouridine(8) synthase ThiI [Deltaproteobacteria bacterium]MBW2134747.1 tRNA 4-thiouridine(8) synthase ThiI [Deltaproteobacteria bacterium]